MSDSTFQHERSRAKGVFAGPVRIDKKGDMECHGRTGIIFQGVSGTLLLNRLCHCEIGFAFHLVNVERGRSRIDAQKGISAQVFGGSTQVFAMAVSGQKAI